ncbi:ferredoxin [Micromonospora endophytica]|uniref:Ferredoxin n=1 Tax=Micromonospora endophytica TaxID=515350 RepID=A0A2W2D5T5_9ACTN|nr:ferredoxin [Micromonospora endophytica]RIW51510.1 ferredoxin [Micromonospora endophytica]
MQVAVDRDACCGSGNCVRVAPEVFAQDDADGLVLLRATTLAPQSGARARRAADLCPSGAIRVASAEALPR